MHFGYTLPLFRTSSTSSNTSFFSQLPLIRSLMKTHQDAKLSYTNNKKPLILLLDAGRRTDDMTALTAVSADVFSGKISLSGAKNSFQYKHTTYIHTQKKTINIFFSHNIFKILNINNNKDINWLEGVLCLSTIHLKCFDAIQI